MLARMLQAKDRGLTIIFSRTKRTAAKVADELADRGFAAAAIHGDLGQGAREQALRAFRNGKVDVLVATDVAARGIDVENVTHVINYQCPEDEKTYLHRIGRTARAGNTGVAVTFVDWDDLPRWGLINRTLDLGIPDPQETYSSSDHLFTELDIPPRRHRAAAARASRPAPGWPRRRWRTSARPARPPAAVPAGAAPAGATRAGRPPRVAAPTRGAHRAGPAPAARAAATATVRPPTRPVRRPRPRPRARPRRPGPTATSRAARATAVGPVAAARAATPRAEQGARRAAPPPRRRRDPRGATRPGGPSVSPGGRQSRSSSAVATSR